MSFFGPILRKARRVRRLAWEPCFFRHIPAKTTSAIAGVSSASKTSFLLRDYLSALLRHHFRRLCTQIRLSVWVN